MVHIRPFEPRDADAVSGVIRVTMEGSNSKDYPPEILKPLQEYFSPSKVTQLAEERRCFVAEEDGRIVGTGALDGSELATFFVYPSEQGRGIGKRILDAVERAARETGLSTIRVESSLTGAAFYERNGYHRTGKTVTRSAGTQIEMEKALA